MSVIDGPYELATIPLDRLFIDRSWQQEPSRHMVDRIASNFDPVMYGTLHVNHRDTFIARSRLRRFKRYWRPSVMYSVIDGCARFRAAERVPDVSTLPCIVKHLPPEAEPAEFVKLNGPGVGAVAALRAAYVERQLTRLRKAR